MQVEIKCDGSMLHGTQLTIATRNIRFIKNKDQLVLRELNYTNTDATIVTESWLKDFKDDKIWIKSIDLNKDPYKCFSTPCINGRGGGLILICKKGIEIKMAVYHLPPNEGITNGMFINEITPHLTNLLTDNQHNIIMGDFNMHVDDPL